MTGSGALIWSPFGDAESARNVASTLLEDQLIACANILPGMTSVYRWKGNVACDSEVGVLFKTSVDLLEEVTSRIAQLHPYETPVVVGWDLQVMPQSAWDWLQHSLGRVDTD